MSSWLNWKCFFGAVKWLEQIRNESNYVIFRLLFSVVFSLSLMLTLILVYMFYIFVIYFHLPITENLYTRSLGAFVSLFQFVSLSFIWLAIIASNVILIYVYELCLRSWTPTKLLRIVNWWYEDEKQLRTYKLIHVCTCIPKIINNDISNNFFLEP